MGQGQLDLRYLATRYEKGRQWTQRYLENNNVMKLMGLPHAHADILQFQKEQGGAGPSQPAGLRRPVARTLNKVCDMTILIHLLCDICIRALRSLRYTIMVLDCTIWPTRPVAVSL